MDAVTLDRLLDEARPAVVDQHLGRARAAGAAALVFDLGRRRRLWLEAGREAPGLYLLERGEEPPQPRGEEPAGRARQALLLARKHLEGSRVRGLVRPAGSRSLLLEAGQAALALRLSGPAPALTLTLGGEAVATLGEGPPALSLEEDAGREWSRLDPERFAALVEEARARGWSETRAILGACPGLGPALARMLAARELGFAELQARLAAPLPALLLPRPLAQCRDADLAPRDAVRLLPFAPAAHAGAVEMPASWLRAGRLFLQARLRGVRFAALQRARVDEARRRGRRLAQLEAHLSADRAGLPPAGPLRRQAEALLAQGGGEPGGAGEVVVPDPYEPERRLRIAVDPRLSLARNADRLFDKARRVERAAVQIEERLAQARAGLEEARADEARALAAVEASELEAPEAARPPQPREEAARRGPRRYLSSRGLWILVGRGARENHHLTFEVAAPEDWWLHVRDSPGAHVVLRDPERRATDGDLREAAELAVFFSDARTQARADVHVTRRKHVRAAGGGPGRVRISHSETLRVAPRDPEGRLRRG